MDRYDGAVVGGGAAGLSGDVAVARSPRSVPVADAGEPRNAPARGAHDRLGQVGVNTEVEQFWEQHYGVAERVWSGRANATLVDVVQDLPPGTALDLGCGEGGDAVWLALRGWRVTAVDVSPTALQRAAAHAEQAGVGDRIRPQRHELGRSFPDGTYDLVSACFLHSPVELPREHVLRRAAAAVAPGGRLVVLGHAGAPSWAPAEHAQHAAFPTPQEVLGSLELPPDAWSTERVELVERTATGPQGQTGHLEDSLVVVQRLARTPSH